MEAASQDDLWRRRRPAGRAQQHLHSRADEGGRVRGKGGAAGADGLRGRAGRRLRLAAACSGAAVAAVGGLQPGRAAL